MVGWHHELNGHESEQIPEVKGREAWRATVHGVAGLNMTKCLSNNNNYQKNGARQILVQ